MQYLKNRCRVCEVKNAGDLSDKMEMMLNLSENERVSIGNAGRVKMVSEFDESIVIGKYLEAVNTISGDVNE